MSEMLELTPSLVDDYRRCAYRWQQLHLHHKGSRAVANAATLSEAISIHRALAEYHRPGRQSTSEGAEAKAEEAGEAGEAEMERILSRQWRSDGYASTQQEDAAFMAAMSKLRYYLRSAHRPRGLVLGTEVSMAALTALGGCAVRLSCRADRLELYEGGILEVLDYKTSASGWVPTTQELLNDPAMFIYFRLAWNAFREQADVREVCVSVLNIVSLRKVSAHYDQRAIVLNKQRLSEVARNIKQRVFEPRPHPGCISCPFEARCPAFSKGWADD